MPHLARYLGFSAALLLAAVGWMGGAFPHGDPAATPAGIARGPYGPIILTGWLLGTVISAYAWWTLRDRIPSPRWALVTAALWAAPFLLVPAMGSRDVYSYACQGYLYVHGLNPYENGVASLPCPWIEGVSPIWRDTAAPYGPLFLLLAALVTTLAGDSLTLVLGLFRLIALLGLALVAAGLPVIARRCGVPVERALWIALAGPLIGAHALAGPHNDALMIGLVVAGLAAAARGRALGAGVLLGLAVGVKVTAVVVVPFAVLLVVARPFRMRPAATVVGAVLGSLALVTAVSGLGFGWIGGLLNTRDLVQFTSPPTAVGMTVTYVGQAVAGAGFDAVPVARGAGLVLLAVVFGVLWWRGLTARIGRDDVGVGVVLRGAALALAAFLAFSPYFHPWYALWALVPLAATTLRTDLIMVVASAAALLVLPDGGGLARFAKFPGAPLMTVLLVVLLVRHLRGRRGFPRRAAQPSSRIARSAA